MLDPPLTDLLLWLRVKVAVALLRYYFRRRLLSVFFDAVWCTNCFTVVVEALAI